MSRRRDRGSEGSLDNFLKKKAGEALDEELEERGQEGLLPLEGDVQPDDPILKKILSAFPSSEGYYGKLYKVLSSGKEEMKYVFNALEEISDPEVSVSELAKERKWGSGDYRLRVFKHGASGCQKSVRLSIGVDEVPLPGQPNQPTQEATVTEKLKELSDIVTTARDIFSKEESGASEKLGQTLAETFKSGVDVVKEALGPQISNSQNNVVGIITALKDLGVFQKPEPTKQVSETEIVERTIKNLKDMGIIGAPKSDDDLLSKLLKLRETGLIKMAGEDKEDVSTLAGKLKPIIEMVTSLGLGGGAPERSTFWNTLAPHIPAFIEKLATPFREYLELRKLEIQQNVRRGGRQFIPLNRGPTGSGLEPGAQVGAENIAANPSEQETPIQLHPIASEILNAVQTRNLNYFPRLKEILVLFIGPHVPEALVTKQVSIDTFLSMIAQSPVGQPFNIPESKIYLQDFISWLEKQAVVSGGNGMVIVKCNACHEEFDITKEEWEDPGEDKKCECGNGILELVSPISA